jgi:hypothetical protein
MLDINFEINKKYHSLFNRMRKNGISSNKKSFFEYTNRNGSSLKR